VNESFRLATEYRSANIPSRLFTNRERPSHLSRRNELQTMIPHRLGLRPLIPTAFALGLCTSAMCLALGSPLGHRRTISPPLHVSETPDRLRLFYGVPSIEFNMPVIEQKVRCRIHGSEIKSVLVGVDHGIPVVENQPEAYLAARETSFPHCDDAIWVGCMPQSSNENFKEVCQECNAARDRWLRRHLPTPKH
jgi:hypothetical protein